MTGLLDAVLATPRGLDGLPVHLYRRGSATPLVHVSLGHYFFGVNAETSTFKVRVRPSRLLRRRNPFALRGTGDRGFADDT
jgi:hypothetical protein